MQIGVIRRVVTRLRQISRTVVVVVMCFSVLGLILYTCVEKATYTASQLLQISAYRHHYGKSRAAFLQDLIKLPSLKESVFFKEKNSDTSLEKDTQNTDLSLDQEISKSRVDNTQNLNLGKADFQEDLIHVPSLKRSVILTGKEIDVMSGKEVQWSGTEDTCETSNSSFNEAVLKTPDGSTPIFLYQPKDDIYVTGSIMKYGTWEKDRVQVLYELLKKDEVTDFLDIGANVGVYTLTFAKMGKRVVAVDPLIQNVRRLCTSIQRGQFQQEIHVLLNGLSDKRYKISFTKSNENVGGTQIKKATASDTQTANAVLLDDLLKVFNFVNVIVKMDVETHEAKVLAGAERFFSTVNVKAVLMEWRFHKGKTDGFEILDFLKRHNMKPFMPSMAMTPLSLVTSRTWPDDVLWIKS